MTRLVLSVLAALLVTGPLYGQSPPAEAEAVKAALRQETQHALGLNLEGVFAGWVHDGEATRTVFHGAGYHQLTSWEAIAEYYTQAAERLREPLRREIRNSNYVIRVGGNTAWAEYDQEFVDESGTVTHQSRQQRLLKKENGRWKIAAMTVLNKRGLGDADEDIEYSVNSLGYRLMSTDRLDAAIEVFKLNVAMFPEAWNTYDSLGEAYMKAGRKEAAIESYRRSLELNSDNEGGRQALAALLAE